MAQNNVLDISKEWQEAKTAIDAHNASLKEAIQLLPQLGNGYKKPSEGVKVNDQLTQSLDKVRLSEIKLQQAREKAIDSYEKKLQKQLENEQKQTKQRVQNILNESKSYQDLEKQKQKAIEAQTKEELALAKAENAYERVKAKINSMLPVYNDLKTKVELGISLNSKEEAKLVLLENRLIKYREVLNTVNKSYGNYSLEVGNYARGTSNLQNAIGQISRELPNFGQSFSIGILSLTNNIGALQDSIKQVKLQNIELKAQGKETTSVMKQIGSSILSFNTALYIGIGLFSAYSKEIGDWVSSLFSGNEILKELVENQKKFNNAKFDGVKDAQTEIFELKKYLSVVKDRSISDEERAIALKQLRSQYPFYFKNLTDEQILTGKSEEAVSKLNLALEKRKEIEKKSEISVTNKQKILDLEKEKDLQLEIIKQTETEIKQLSKRDFVRPEAFAAIGDKQEKANKRLLQIRQSLNLLTKDDLQNDADIFNLKKETIALEYQDDKSTKTKTKKEKIALTFAEIESEYQLQKAILERQKVDLKYDVTQEFEDRLSNLDKFTQKSIELINLEYNYKEAKANESYKNDLEKNNVAFRNKELTTSQHLQNVKDITNRYNNEIKTIQIERSNNYDATMEADLKTCEQIEAEKRDITFKETQRIIHIQSDKYKRESDNEKNSLAFREENFKKYIEIEQRRLESEKLKALADEKDIERQKEIVKSYQNQIDKLNELKSPLAQFKEKLNEAFKSEALSTLTNQLNDLGMNSLQKLLDFTVTADGKIQNTFMQMSEALKGSGKEWTLYASTLAGVMKDTFNIIASNRNAVFDEERTRLDSQYEYQKQFAVGNSEAEAELARQLEKKKREIANREAKAKKDQTIFNISMNMAQGITAALASVPPNPILAGIIGAMGLAQIAFASSKKVPQYYKGRSGGKAELAIKDELGAELQTDRFGNIKDFGTNKGAKYAWLDEGDNIYTAEQTKKIFSNFTAEKPKQGNSTTTIIQEKNIAPNMYLTINKHGINGMIVEGSKKATIENNYYEIKGYNV